MAVIRESHRPTAIPAVKVAFPVVRGERVLFRAVTRHDTYGPDDMAQCMVLRKYPDTHGPLPDPCCTCGFYALPGFPRGRAARVVLNSLVAWLGRRLGRVTEVYSPAVLDVELLGRVIVHEKGYRASHQRIMRAYLDGRCFACGRRAKGFGAPTFIYGQADAPMRSTCGCRMPVRWSIQDVRDMAGTEVEWDRDRKPLLTLLLRRA